MRKLDRVPQTLGSKLRALRKGQAVSLDMMSRMTRIQKKYLVALEHGDFSSLPEPFYARNFIRTYARALKADESYFVELFDEECGSCDCTGHLKTPRQKLRKNKLIIWNRFVKIGIVSSISLAFLFYLGFQIRSIAEPPELSIVSPADASTISEPLVAVEGLVEKESTVYINGEQVILGTDNAFYSEIDLDKGLNVIRIEARRRYSKTAVVERRVIFTPKTVPQVGFNE